MVIKRSRIMRNIVLIISCFCALSMWSQKINRPDSYNYTRGLEAFQNNNFEEASDYLNKEIIGHFFIKFISFLPVLSMILMPYRLIVDNNYLSAIFYFVLNSLVIYLLIKKGLVIYKKNLLK